MKRLLVALLTFAIGVFAFGLLSYKTSFNVNLKNDSNLPETSVSTITPNLDIQPEKTQEIKTENDLPFFNSFEYDKAKINPTNEYVVQSFSGWFIADDFKGMPEVWTILLVRDSEYPHRKFQWTAMVLTNLKDGSSDDDADFSSIWIKTENNKLNFKTKKYRNVEYKFSGEFLRNGKNFEQEEKVLKGTMQKFVKGKKVAEFTSDFAYYEPRCYH